VADSKKRRNSAALQDASRILFATWLMRTAAERRSYPGFGNSNGTELLRARTPAFLPILI
jgi:hypothetical protein